MQSLSFLSDKKGSTVIDWLKIQLFLISFRNIIILLCYIFSAVYIFLNHCGYPATEADYRQIRRCLRTSRLPSVYVAFGYDDVYRHPVYLQFSQCTWHCLTSFGDTRTVSARIADRADYGLLNPARNCGSGWLRSPESCQFAARIHPVTPRPARGIDGYQELTEIKRVHPVGNFRGISVQLCKYWF